MYEEFLGLKDTNKEELKLFHNEIMKLAEDAIKARNERNGIVGLTKSELRYILHILWKRKEYVIFKTSDSVSDSDFIESVIKKVKILYENTEGQG
jgi:hypothetical protein